MTSKFLIRIAFLVLLLYCIAIQILIAAPKASTLKKNNARYNYSNYNCSKYGLSLQAFDYAIKGLQQQISKGAITNPNTLTIADYSLPSNVNRLFVLNLNKQKVQLCTRVAHGQGSGGLYATQFSNVTDSHQSSLGVYKIGDTYIGQHGPSLILYGLQKGINDNAYNRNIVIHGSNYVSDAISGSNEATGRSWGCPAVSNSVITKLIKFVSKGTCFVAYAKAITKKYAI